MSQTSCHSLVNLRMCSRALLTWSIVAVFPLASASADAPNVLFIVADDLNCAISPYGDTIARTPNLDRIAARGLTFERAYCQQAVCNPSRSSFLTGLRPNTVKVDDLRKSFRNTAVGGHSLVTLPQHFKSHGYFCQNIGKIFHNMGDTKDRRSWSIDEVLFEGTHAADTVFFNAPREGKTPPYKAPVTEAHDVPDTAYRDGQIANLAAAMLREHTEGQQPFFLAVGFWRPHLPFVAPKKYWDLYDPQQIPLPTPTSPPSSVPEIAMHSSREIKGYGQTPKDRLFTEEETRHYRHGYYAAISFMDAQIGKILDALEASGQMDNTIVVFTSDHGFHIGEKTLWGKTSNFELDARVPLLISAPGYRAHAGKTTSALVELVDLYPTLTDLAGISKDQPANLEGLSLSPVLKDPSATVKKAAFTQHQHPFYGSRANWQAWGYSMRTDRWRYTEWRDIKTGKRQARELYDHKHDPLETANLANHSEMKATATALATQLDRKLASTTAPPHAVSNPESPLMLELKSTGRNANKINYTLLPRVPSNHTIISDVRDRAGKHVHQHAYLAYHDSRYWAMWSDGPGLPAKGISAEKHRNVVPGHDRPGTRVSYATSGDGLRWSKPRDLSGAPRIAGFGWIARGFWIRDGTLLALASHFNAPAYPGKGLSLEAFHWDKSDRKWHAHGTVLDDTLNNFPPKRLPSGEFMMTRRDHRQQVSVMIGGDKAFDRWQIRPLAKYDAKGRPEEPYWYVLPDNKNLVGLIRDNGRSGRLLRTFSTDNGRHWSQIVRTNFPDATSKFFVLRTSRGYYAMVSNSNPRRRDPLTLAISHDGLVFKHLFYLVGGRHIDYPHIIEHDGQLLIAFSGAKQTMEVLRVSLDEVDRLINGEQQVN